MKEQRKYHHWRDPAWTGSKGFDSPPKGRTGALPDSYHYRLQFLAFHHTKSIGSACPIKKEVAKQHKQHYQAYSEGGVTPIL